MIMDKKKRLKIQSIYDKFHKEFYSEKYKAVRDALKSISLREKNNSKHLHDLGKFVIFYSLPTVSPKIVVIGNNPSWFHPSNSTLAKENLDDVAEKIPTINSYEKHRHKFGDALINIFNEIGREHWIDEIVGLNRFWIQTGGKGTKELKKECKSKKKYQDLKNLCEKYTKELVEILNPKLIILLGKPAQKIYKPIINNSFYNPNDSKASFIFALHPTAPRHEAWKQTADEIYTFLDENEINY